MKTIAITGASGFVGTSLINYFTNLNYEVIKIKREYLSDSKKLEEIVNKADILINLAGANIISRWSQEYKKTLYNSRINTTKSLISAIKNVEKKPEILISTSAVGIYDNKASYDENGNFSDDFLGKLAKDWESEANKAKEYGVKTSIFRFGIVLGKDGGALEKMLPPFKMGVGGTIGDGKQSFSFIHISDLLDAYKFVIENRYDGVFNITAPTPTTNKGLTKALGKHLNRPTIFPIPTFVLNIIFSEGAQVLTDGQSAVPKHLLDLGFKFKFHNIDETIKDLVK
ncbi:MAG: TIGR01777 family oxidoreductase [Campylobacterota bacterium]